MRLDDSATSPQLPVKANGADDMPEVETHVGRFGSFVLVGQFERPYQDVVERVLDALSSDSRVLDVQKSKFEEQWFRAMPLLRSPSEGDDLITGRDSMVALRFSDPIRFALEVPVKNQPSMNPGDPIPTHYEVIWDGVSVLTTWTMGGTGPLPMSGGHIVERVLSDAAVKAGFELYVQGCNPACKNGFAHTTLRLCPVETPPTLPTFSPSKWQGEVDVTVPATSQREAATWVFRDLRMILEDFTALKNLGRRLLEIERDSRSVLDEIVSLAYARYHLHTYGPIERVTSRWRLRRWRRDSRRLIAKMWLELAVIERLRREWDALRFSFEEAAGQRGREGLFALDYADEVDRVERLDAGLMRAGVEHAAARLDTGAMVSMTGVAAVAGAVAGALVAAATGGIF